MGNTLADRTPERGKRVRYSEEGRRRFPNTKRREGTIVGQGHEGSCWSIHWDGTGPRTRDAIHKSFISIIPD